MGAVNQMFGDTIDLRDINRYIQRNADLIVAAAARGDADAQQIVAAVNIVIDAATEERMQVLVVRYADLAQGPVTQDDCASTRRSPRRKV